MPELQRAQFEELASRLREPDGGFSIRVPTGHEPDKGFMVSQAGTERSYPPSHNVTGGEIENYSHEHYVVLHRRSRYLGGWHDPSKHRKALDISRLFYDHTRAYAKSLAADQDALYNLNNWHSEPNFEKLGTADSAIAHVIKEGPDPHYAQLQRFARARLRGERAKAPAFIENYLGRRDSAAQHR